MPDLLTTDAELYAAVKLDNQKAFNMLYDRYWKLVYKKAFSYIADSEVCQEIVNDIFYNIWKNRGTREINLFKNYLTVAARYRVYSHIRANKESLLLTYIDNYQDIKAVLLDENDGEKNIRSEEMKGDIEIALKDLPKRCQEVFSLSRNSQLTNVEIADKLSISKRSVDNQISLAVKYLRIVFTNYSLFLVVIRLFFTKS
ncbi:RNA polymerase sigma-70 factor (family 1) [Pedobacter sp. UYP30]|uniref:sigma-70 family RNA polymerase sigma factor n=1 Tax=Pedobacter sp. UYP30 TaxID=1756400 RepID=UPI0033937316